ncbi:MAG: S9 family peptidase [Phycisphaerales bacterium]|nr:S9 family peptidase [Phycisphaerales bacterium]
MKLSRFSHRRAALAHGAIVAPCLAGLVSLAGCAAPQKGLTYPQAQRVEQVDDYHGVKVADPYRWLENPDSPESRAWIDAENTITFGFLESVPQREGIRKRLTELWDFEKFDAPFMLAGRYFYSHNDGLQNQNVIFVQDGLKGEPRVLLDPNTLSKDGTVALSGLAISDNARLLAYGLASAGSDWQEWKVRDIDTGQDLPDHLQWVKFSGASWTLDNAGFYYARYDEPKDGNKLQAVNKFQKLYYHKVGAPQSDDLLVYERKDQPDWGFGGAVTEDGRYLVIAVSQGTDPRNLVFYKDLAQPAAPVVELISTFEADYEVVGNEGTTFWVKTDYNAPRKRIVAIDVTKPAKENWKEIIPEDKATLQGVSVVNDQFVCNYLKDAYSQVKVFGLTGQFVREVAFPGLGSVGGFGGKRKYTETFYSFTSFTAPTTIFRYDLTAGKSELFKEPKVRFNAADYETRQVFYPSKDGTRVPMFITYKKGLKLNGKNPTVLYGYGGFNIPVTPAFSVANLVWMEMGGVYASANLRGGGEYGKEWHDAGRLGNKQNVFDDFIAAAEWLIKNKYTSRDKLAILGGSNGGLLVGACTTQRPDLFGACLPAVGVMDMLRFHKFTIGWAWTSDYGSPDDPKAFQWLSKYSPYHTIKSGTAYPATMITTADHDDRVVPAHSFKYAAALQAAQGGAEPILIRIETQAGHGAGKPTSKRIEEAADRWAFLVKTLDMSVKMD